MSVFGVMLFAAQQESGLGFGGWLCIGAVALFWMISSAAGAVIKTAGKVVSGAADAVEKVVSDEDVQRGWWWFWRNN